MLLESIWLQRTALYRNEKIANFILVFQKPMYIASKVISGLPELIIFLVPVGPVELDEFNRNIIGSFEIIHLFVRF